MELDHHNVASSPPPPPEDPPSFLEPAIDATPADSPTLPQTLSACSGSPDPETPSHGLDEQLPSFDPADAAQIPPPPVTCHEALLESSFVEDLHCLSSEPGASASADGATEEELSVPEAADRATNGNGSAMLDNIEKDIDESILDHARDSEKPSEQWRNDTVEPSGVPNDASRWIPASSSHVAGIPAAEKVPHVSRRKTYYLVRIPRVLDSTLRNKIRMAELELEEASKNRDFIRTALQLKRANKAELIEKLKLQWDKERACSKAILKKKMEIDPLQDVLNKVKPTHNSMRDDICSTEEELDNKIAYLQHRIQHESIPLKEEKQLIREIKQLESTRSRVCANEAAKTQLIEIFGSREEIEEQCSILYQELAVLKNEQSQLRAECEPAETQLQGANSLIEELVIQLDNAKKAQQAAFTACKSLKKLLSEQNSEFYKNKEDVRKAKEFASAKDWEKLDAFCNEQVEGILNRWSNDASFREKYIKNNEQSTLRRLETLDGRSLGPDEEPILLMNDVDVLSVPTAKMKETDPVESSKKITVLEIKESKVDMAPVEDDILPAKVTKAPPTKALKKGGLEKLAVKNVVPVKGENRAVETSEPSKPSSKFMDDAPAVSEPPEGFAMKEAQAAELKEKRRQEEMAKAREAAERKRRQMERAQAKALLRAQKDEERREKEREKKARKKAATMAPVSEPSEALVEEKQRDVALVSEMPLKDSSSSGVKVSSSQRRKPPGKKTRPSLIHPLPQRGFWPVPVWVWVLFGVFFSVLVALISFSRKPLSLSFLE